MKKIMVYNILLLAGCASAPTNCVSTQCIKDQARQEMFRDCMKNTVQYGYPVKAIDWGTLSMSGLRISSGPSEFCKTISRTRIK